MKTVFPYPEVSRAVDSLYSNYKKNLNLPIEERIANSLLPSNVDSSVASENLKQELLGKLKPSNCNKVNLGGNCKAIVHPKVGRINKNMQLNTNKEIEISKKHKVSKVAQQDGFESIIETQAKEQVIQDQALDLTSKTSTSILPPLPSCKEVPKPLHLVKEVKVLLQSSSQLSKPVFSFTVSKVAALQNYLKLLKYNFELEALINTSGVQTICNYGSEFKSVEMLDRMMRLHPRWKQLRERLKYGSKWDLKKINNEDRLRDVEAAIERGNHKSAVINKEFLAEALAKEVKKGWMLVLPLEKAMNIPQLVMSPMGVVEQLGISHTGDFVKKKRITHDLSFPGQASKTSVNSRVIKKNLEPCMFGYTMLRIIHWILHLRRIHPFKKIWIRKEDAKSAYRRMHLHVDTVLKTGVQIEMENTKYLLLSLRLPFGGSPCPSEFCLLSDLLTDTINDLMSCEDWEPSELHSNYLLKIPKPTSLPEAVPFAQAKDVSVSIEEGDICKSDVFIDDIITMGVDVADNLKRIMAAPCTVMHAFTHSVDGPSHIPRQNFIADDKNEAEGGPEEVKIVLGWELNSRSLSVHLPFHKFRAWSSQVDSFLSRKTSNAKDLQSVLGRLENIAIMIPMFAHFLNNIRALEIKASLTSKNQFLNQRTKDDFELAKRFIAKAHAGVNMNLISFREPTKVYINDASEHGLGGFASHGRAWSYTLPKKLRGRAHINLLEFMAQLVSIWLDAIEGRLEPLDCLLAMGDNTASMGWLRRSNFRENDEDDVEWLVKQKVARKLAEVILDSQTCLYRQWFKGEENVLADSLSRDGFLFTEKAHKQFLLKTSSSQVPQDFNICPLPKKICSFISSMLLQLPVKKQRLLAQKPSELVLLNVGALFCSASTYTAFSLTDFQNFNKISSCPHSLKPCEKLPSLQQIKMNWWRERSVPPCHMWHRPSGQTTGLTQDWTSTVKLALSSKNNSEDIAMKMADDENRRLFQ